MKFPTVSVRQARKRYTDVNDHCRKMEIPFTTQSEWLRRKTRQPAAPAANATRSISKRTAAPVYPPSRRYFSATQTNIIDKDDELQFISMALKVRSVVCIDRFGARPSLKQLESTLPGLPRLEYFRKSWQA